MTGNSEVGERADKAAASAVMFVGVRASGETTRTGAAPLNRRARHVITENARVLDTVSAIRRHDLHAIAWTQRGHQRFKRFEGDLAVGAGLAGRSVEQHDDVDGFDLLCRQVCHDAQGV